MGKKNHGFRGIFFFFGGGTVHCFYQKRPSISLSLQRLPCPMFSEVVVRDANLNICFHTWFSMFFLMVLLYEVRHYCGGSSLGVSSVTMVVGCWQTWSRQDSGGRWWRVKTINDFFSQCSELKHQHMIESTWSCWWSGGWFCHWKKSTFDGSEIPFPTTWDVRNPTSKKHDGATYCWWFRNPVNNHLLDGAKKTVNGLNYQPQLVSNQRIFEASTSMAWTDR